MKQHSIRTDDKKDKIISNLKFVISKKAQGSSITQSVVTSTPAPEAEPRKTTPHEQTLAQVEQLNVQATPTPHAQSMESPSPAATVPVIPLVPAQSKAEVSAPAGTETTVETAATLPRPSPPPSRTTQQALDEKRMQVRKTFERVLRAQNLPHETLKEKKTQVLTAAITLWQHNPQLKFAQMERVLHYYLEFTMADAATMAEMLKLHEPVPKEQVRPHDSAKDNAEPSHKPEQADDCEGDDDGMHR